MLRRSPGLAARLVCLCALLAPAFAARAQTHEDWSYNRAVYEVNVRQYTPEGTFSAFGAHLERLRSLGVDVLWFMPVHPIGRQNRIGALGSPYAVRDYRAANPDMGTLADFRAVVDRAHGLGMKVMIDWVANHTAWDNALTAEHPEWYAKDAQGRFIPPPGTNWSDVIELDYGNAALRDYMIESMRFWVREAGVDGFRFDAVSFVPTDFWTRATAELKATRPDLLLLAEADGAQWHAAGFDATYGWGLYGFGNGLLADIRRGTKNALALHGYASDQTSYPASAYRMYFTSNHDENSFHGTTAGLFGDAAPAFAVLTATFPGLPLIYSGQEAGLSKRLSLFDKDLIPWRAHPDAARYATLLALKRRNRALWNGRHGGALRSVFSSNNAAVFAFLREKEADRVFVALNLSAQAQTVTLSGTFWSGAYADVFTGAPVTLGAGATITLPPWGFAVYEARPATAAGPDDAAPASPVLGPNRPNPFRAATTLTYTLGAPADVVLTVTDVLGREVRRLVSGPAPAGTHDVVFDGAGLPGGVYLLRLDAAGRATTRRVTLLR